MSALLHHCGRPAWGRFLRRLAGWPVPGHATHRRKARPSCEALEDRIVPHTGPALLAVGAPAGSAPLVRLLDADTGAEVRSFLAYDPSFTGGVCVALADLNGDGTADIVTAPGPGGGPNVKVFDGASGAAIASFFAYDPSFSGGVYVAAGDIGHGEAGIVTGADAGGGPHVAVFTATGTPRASFYAYDPAFTGGVRVALGHGADGNAEVVTGAGPGGGPHVQAFDLRTGKSA